MADTKISALPSATTPLVGTEELPIVQSGATDKVSVANLTAGRSVAVKDLTATSTSSSTIIGFARTGIAGLNLLADGSGPILQPTTVDGIQIYNAALNTRRFRLRTDTGNLELSTGNLVIGTSGKGIDFSADGSAAGMTSELLDDYEEGAWTPVLTASNAPSYTATSVGTYTKIGNQVTINAYINVSAVSTTGSITVGCSGFPFAVNASALRFSGVVSRNSTYTTSHVSSIYAIGGATYGYFYDNSLRSTVNDGLVAGDLWFTMTYFV